MIRTTLRALTDAFNSVTYGINVQIGALQLEGSDTRPATMSLIANELSAGWVATGNLPPSGSVPAIGIQLLEQVEMDGEIQGGAARREAHITIYSRVILRQSKTEKGNLDMYYSLEAMEKCIGVFMSAAKESDRLRNNMQICECTTMTHTKDMSFVDDNVMAGGIKATFRVRSLNP